MAESVKVKRWAVRRPGGYYVLSAGHRPYKSPTGHWVTSSDNQWIRNEVWESLFPEYRLPESGGPVEIRFADEA